MKTKLLIFLLLINSLYALGSNISRQRFALRDEGNHTVLQLDYEFFIREENQGFTKSVFPTYFGGNLLIQKIIFHNSEKIFYNLDFRDGCFVVLKDGSQVGVLDSESDIKQLEKELFDYQNVGDLQLGGFWRDDWNSTVVSVTINLAEKIDPQQVSALVLIYGVKNIDIQLLDFNSILFVGAKQSSCKVAYIPVTGYTKNGNDSVLSLEKAQIKHLGDGIIIAPVIPLFNFNSPKTKQSVLERFL